MIEITESQIARLVMETLNRTYQGRLYMKLGKAWSPKVKENSFFNKVEDLGYKHRLTAAEYDGDFTDAFRTYYTKCENYERTKDELEHLMNLYGYSIINRKTFYSYEDDCEMCLFTFEANYNGEPLGDYGNDVYYHACPKRSLSKILRQGLVPKDRGKLNLDRPSRIYLLSWYDETYFRNLNKKDGEFVGKDWDYAVLKVDLTGMKDRIRLYQDPYSMQGMAYYTADIIPPQCLSVVKP